MKGGFKNINSYLSIWVIGRIVVLEERLKHLLLSPLSVPVLGMLPSIVCTGGEGGGRRRKRLFQIFKFQSHNDNNYYNQPQVFCFYSKTILEPERFPVVRSNFLKIAQNYCDPLELDNNLDPQNYCDPLELDNNLDPQNYCDPLERDNNLDPQNYCDPLEQDNNLDPLERDNNLDP